MKKSMSTLNVSVYLKNQVKSMEVSQMKIYFMDPLFSF